MELFTLIIKTIVKLFTEPQPILPTHYTKDNMPLNGVSINL